MRSILALFLIGIIAVSAQNSEVSYLKSISGTQFGRNLIETIQIELKTSTGADAIDRIINLLQKINDDIVETGKSDTATHTTYVTNTRAQLKALAAKVVSLTADLKTDRALIQANLALIAADQKLIKGFQKQVAQQQEGLKENLATQKETTRVYNIEFAKLSGYIAGLASARGVIQNMVDTKNTVSFVEVANKLNQVELTHPKYSGFMNVLSEMLSSTERVHGTTHVNAVIRLLDLLRDQLIKEITRLTAVYKRRMADLKIQENRYRTTIAILESNIAKAEQRIAQKEMENTMANQRIITNEQRKAEAIQEGKDLNKALSDAIKAYNQRVAQRKEELAIIAKIVKLFKGITDEVRSSIENLTMSDDDRANMNEHLNSATTEKAACVGGYRVTSEYTSYELTYVAGNNVRTVRGSVQDCKDACDQDANCLSIDYNNKREKCYFNKISLEDAQTQGLVKEKKDYTLYGKVLGETC